MGIFTFGAIGVVFPAVHGGHVLCDRGQEDGSGVLLPQYVHL